MRKILKVGKFEAQLFGFGCTALLLAVKSTWTHSGIEITLFSSWRMLKIGGFNDVYYGDEYNIHSLWVFVGPLWFQAYQRIWK